MAERKTCKKCKKIFPKTKTHFYFKPDGNALSYCKKCHGKYTASITNTERQRVKDERNET